MKTVEYNDNQYRVQSNGLVQRLQATKNNGFGWVVVNPKTSYIECLRVIKLAK
jgi:hypothetical protein